MINSKILIVISNYYPEISEALEKGAKMFLECESIEYDTVYVTGALEVPPAISFCAESDQDYLGYVALGCVIRGETTHYDLVVGNSYHGLMMLGIQKSICIGNGILAVENKEQAVVRADPNGKKNAGAWAAKSALILSGIKSGRRT